MIDITFRLVADSHCLSQGVRMVSFEVEGLSSDMDDLAHLKSAVITFQDFRHFTCSDLIKTCRASEFYPDTSYVQKSFWAVSKHFALEAATQLAMSGARTSIINSLISPYLPVKAILTIIGPSRADFADLGLLNYWSKISEEFHNLHDVNAWKSCICHAPYMHRNTRGSWTHFNGSDKMTWESAKEESLARMLEYIAPEGCIGSSSELEIYVNRLKRHIKVVDHDPIQR